jgi:hypothetical protein
MLIAEPFASVIALILITSDEIEALLEGSIALCALLFFLSGGLHLGLKAKRKYLKLVFKLIFEQNL